MEQTIGGVSGFGAVLCAIKLDYIPFENIVQTVVLSALGALVGFIVTFLLKKVTKWIEN